MIKLDDSHGDIAAAISAAYPALRAQIALRPGDIREISRGRLRIPRDLPTYRRLAAALIPDIGDNDAVRRGLRIFAQRERLRVAARELRGREVGDVDVTARELSDLAQVCIEIALAEAQHWAEARFGKPVTDGGAPCAITILGMGKLGGRELNCGSDVDLIPFYETDEGTVQKDGVVVEQTLHEHFMRITQRFTATLEDVTEDGLCWRVDLRLRPEGSRGPLVNALAAAERYYETWGRTWERGAMLRARPVAGNPAFGQRLIDALSGFVWRKAIDPRIANEMAQLVVRARIELSDDAERDLKLGLGGIREAEFFVQSLQLIWGGREPSLRQTNTLEALRRLRSRGLVTDRESREVEAAYLALRRLEHRVQFATGIQTHVLPRGEMLETIARSLGHATGLELERDIEKTRRKVAALWASLTKAAPGASPETEALLTAIDSGEEALVLTAIAEGAGGFRSSPTPDLARHLLALGRRPDFPLGASARDRHPVLASTVLEALSDAADPEQAARLLGAFFARLSTPSVYAKAMAEDTHVLRRLVGLFGASAFLGEAMVYRPELMDSVVFAKIPPTPETARSDVDAEVSAAEKSDDADPTDAFAGALRRAKARVTMEVGLAELAGEVRGRDATRALSALADATLEQATRRALAERKLTRGLAVIAMGKLGGREIGYGSDLDIFFVYEAAEEEDDLAEKYIRVAQRVLSLVSMPHGQGPGYELDTRLRPSGSQGLLVVSLESFARYHQEQGQAWERQALIKARFSAGDAALGQKVIDLAAKVAYERGATEAEAMHRLRMRMELELAREGPRRYDVKIGYGGLVDVEFAVQWLQMKYGTDVRVRSSDTETAIGALEAAGYLDAGVAAVFRDGYAFLRRLEQALRIVHGTSASLIEEGAPGLPALARRMGFRDGANPPPEGTEPHVEGDRQGREASGVGAAGFGAEPHVEGDRQGREASGVGAAGFGAEPHVEAASDALLERYRAITRDIRAAYVGVLGV